MLLLLLVMGTSFTLCVYDDDDVNNNILFFKVMALKSNFNVAGIRN